MASRKIGKSLSLTGMSHRIDAMPVDGSKWVGLISVESPAGGGLLLPEDALALRDWLNERLAEQVDISRPPHDDTECDQAWEEQEPTDLCRECFFSRCGLSETPKEPVDMDERLSEQFYIESQRGEGITS